MTAIGRARRRSAPVQTGPTHTHTQLNETKMFAWLCWLARRDQKPPNRMCCAVAFQNEFEREGDEIRQKCCKDGREGRETTGGWGLHQTAAAKFHI